MTTIPGINCKTLSCVREAMEIIKTLPASWVQVDISDGIFTPARTFNDPKGFKDLCRELRFSNNIEVHLMVKNPENYLSDWLSVGIKRVIIHTEAVRDENELESYKRKCEKNGAELGLALNPDTTVEEKKNLLKRVSFIQILAVPPGFSGQRELDVGDKVSFLRETFPRVTIEMDGGVNEETGKISKKKGADILVSVSYILKSKSPQNAYQTLRAI